MVMTSAKEQAVSDEAFRAELRSWLVQNITDEFRENRDMSFRERVAVRRTWQKKLFEAGWVGVRWPKEYGGREKITKQNAAALVNVPFRQDGGDEETDLTS